MQVRQSALGAYQRCPQQKKLYDAAEAGGVRAENLSLTAYGTVMHHALHVLERMAHAGAADALEVALATFTHYWKPEHLDELVPGGVDVWLPRSTYGGLRTRGVHTLRDYADILARDPGWLLALEYHFEVPLVIDGVEHTLSGTVDRLALRQFQGSWYLSIEDFKTGKKPTALRWNVQFSAYAYASTRAEFWTGFGDLLAPVQAALDAHGMDLLTLSRRGRWIGVRTQVEISDAGWRTEVDYARLILALREYVHAHERDVFPLTLSGETCEYCPFARNGACGGVAIPELDTGVPEHVLAARHTEAI